jgi:methyl-accepting chemotaxis protein
MTEMVKSDFELIFHSTNKISLESIMLGKATQEITSGMTEMATGAEQINVAINEVNDISIQNKKIIGNLVNDLSRFKVD